MKGHSLIWIPGFDHAGIATQAVVEKYLHKTKNIKRNDMSKDDFLKVVNEWKDEKRSVITEQLRTLGASLDWSREYFTISEVNLYKMNQCYYSTVDCKKFNLTAS